MSRHVHLWCLALLTLTACGGGGGGGSSGGGGGGTHPWTFETIVSGTNLGNYPRIALSSTNTPHVSWLDLAQTNGLYVESRRVGGTWEHHGIAPARGPNLRGVRNDIAVDASGAPRVCFEVPDDSIKLGSWNGASFDVTALTTDLDPFPGGSHPDSAWAFVGHNRMAADPTTGTLWTVMWLSNDVTGGQRTLRYWSSGGASTGEIDRGTAGGDTYTGRSPSIALDGMGRPHVAWEGYNAISFENTVKYAAWDGAAFQVQTVDNGVGPAGAASEAYQPISVAVDPSGVPHVAYHKSGAGYVLAAWDGMSWSAEVISSDGVSAGTDWIDLAFAPDGTPHVVFFSLSGVRYAERTTSGWAVATLHSAGVTPAIRVGSDGTVRVVYWNNDTESLRYGWK